MITQINQNGFNGFNWNENIEKRNKQKERSTNEKQTGLKIEIRAKFLCSQCFCRERIFVESEGKT
jgi:hypothetical protein